MPDSAASVGYRFGRFELQPDERRLLAAGFPVRVGPHAFDLLIALVERSGRLVTKDELLERVWPKVIVEENTLQAHMSALRKILGSDAIATISRRGYRFTPEVTPVGATATTPTPKPALPAAPGDQLHWSREGDRRARRPPYNASSARPGRRVRLDFVQDVRRLPQILPRVENWQTIHLRRGNVERPVLPQRQRIRPDQMPVVNHRLKRRVESVRRSLRRIEPPDGVELPVRQINAPLRVRFQATHFALVAQVLDRRGHGGVGLGEIRQHGGIHGIQVPAGNRAVVDQLASRKLIPG